MIRALVEGVVFGAILCAVIAGLLGLFALLVCISPGC